MERHMNLLQADHFCFDMETPLFQEPRLFLLSQGYEEGRLLLLSSFSSCYVKAASSSDFNNDSMIEDMTKRR